MASMRVLLRLLLLAAATVHASELSVVYESTLADDATTRRTQTDDWQFLRTTSVTTTIAETVAEGHHFSGVTWSDDSSRASRYVLFAA